MFSPPPFQLEKLPLVVARFLRSGQEQHHAAVAVGQCVPGIEPDGLVVVGDGLVVVLLVVSSPAAVVVGSRVTGIEPDGFVVVGDGPVVVLLGAPGESAADVGGCVTGIEPDGLVVVGDGLVVVLLGPLCVAAVVVGSRVTGIEPDGLVVVGDGDVEFFPRLPDIGSPEVVGRGARVGADQVGDVVDRLVDRKSVV